MLMTALFSDSAYSLTACNITYNTYDTTFKCKQKSFILNNVMIHWGSWLDYIYDRRWKEIAVLAS